MKQGEKILEKKEQTINELWNKISQKQEMGHTLKNQINNGNFLFKFDENNKFTDLRS